MRVWMLKRFDCMRFPILHVRKKWITPTAAKITTIILLIIFITTIGISSNSSSSNWHDGNHLCYFQSKLINSDLLFRDLLDESENNFGISSKESLGDAKNIYLDQSLNTWTIQQMPIHMGRVDKRRLIKIFDKLWIGDLWERLMSSYDVCLSTQGSMDRLYWVTEQLGQWQGPLSLAVYINNPMEYVGLNLMVDLMRRCDDLFRKFVSIHVAIPAKFPKSLFNSTNMQNLVFEKYGEILRNAEQFRNCGSVDKFIQYVSTTFKPQKEDDYDKYQLNKYPQNHMRNIAREGCGTNWVFSVDIDIIPWSNSADALHRFYEREKLDGTCKKCAYVIPTYELDIEESFPKSKAELVALAQQGKAGPFHFKVFQEAQNATNYKEWEESHLADEEIKISHDAVTSLMKYYEPFYISSDDIPAFEERFVGYGFTRSSQVKEALWEGWTFKVLTPAFAIHWGLQNMDTLINPSNNKAIRRAETAANRKVFNGFLNELKLREKVIKEQEEAYANELKKLMAN